MKKRKHSKETREKIARGIRKARQKKKKEQEDQAFADKLLDSFKQTSKKKASKYVNPKLGKEWYSSDEPQENIERREQHVPIIDITMENAVKRRNNSKMPSEKILEQNNEPKNTR